MARAEEKVWVRNPVTGRAGSPRGFLGFAAALLLVLVAHPSPISFCAGLPLVIAGEALRIWAAGYLQKTRTLVAGGPYAHLRHPLYAGTLLIVTGFCLISGLRQAALAGPLFLGFFFGYYLPHKESREGRRLALRHGDLYAAYRAEVPALIPRWSPWRAEKDSGPPQRWDRSRVRENDEVGTALAVASAVVLLLLVALVR